MKKLIILLSLIMIFLSCGVSDNLKLSGILERKIIEVSAPISEIIVDLPVKIGDHVNKGTVIVRLDTEVAEAELKAHEAALSAAKALLKEYSGEFSRQDKLRKMNVATIQAYDMAFRKRDEALAKVAEKMARITQVNKRLADLTIRARVSGTIDQLPYEKGERAPAGGVVAIISADDNPWVRTWLPSGSVTLVKLGQKVFIKVAGIKKQFNGIIEYISREPEFTPHYALTERESAHLVYETKIRLTSSEKELSPGLSAWVEIPIKIR